MRVIEGFPWLVVEIAKVFDFRSSISGFTETLGVMEVVGEEVYGYLHAVWSEMGHRR